MPTGTAAGREPLPKATTAMAAEVPAPCSHGSCPARDPQSSNRGANASNRIEIPAVMAGVMAVTSLCDAPHLAGSIPRGQGDPWAQPGHLERLHAFVWVQGQSCPGWVLVPDLGFVSASAGLSLRRKPQLHIPGLPGKRPRARLCRELREREDWGGLHQRGPNEEESEFLALLQPRGVQVRRVHRGEAVSPGMLLAGFRVRAAPGWGDAQSPRQPRDRGCPFPSPRSAPATG